MAAAAYFDRAGCAVGIDLELVEPRAENFIQDFFTKSEAEYALNLEGEARNEWVTLAWSAKEAVLKAWQKGLRVDTRAIELILGERQPGQNGWTRLDYRSNRKDFPACWLGWRRIEDYVLTLAYTLADKEGEVEIRQVVS
jgi:phosphopantetheine--protein transferase-like protein